MLCDDTGQGAICCQAQGWRGGGGQIGRADRTPDDPLLLILAVSVLADPARTGASP